MFFILNKFDKNMSNIDEERYELLKKLKKG